MLTTLKTKLRALLRKSEVERELDEELRYHIEQQVEQNIRLGMNPEEARQAALKSFGGVEQAKERSRDARGVKWIDDLLQDLRYGARMLLKNPGFTLIAVITLALGIGANTAILSVADKLLLRQLPVKNPSRLALISAESVNPKFQNTIFSYPDYVDYRDQNEVFSDLFAFIAQTVKLGTGEQSNEISLELVSGNYFDALGVAAAQGRVIRDEDNRAEDAHPVAVISHNCWQRRFGGQPGVVGQALLLNGASYFIIGVAPAHFTGMTLEVPAEAWVPLMMQRQLSSATTSNSERRMAWLRLMGRLKPGVTLAQAQVSFDLTAQRIWEANTSLSDRKLPFNERRFMLEPGGQGISSLRPSLGDTLKLLLAVVALLLLLACANVSNLLLARGVARRKEIAMRLALGASRWQIIRQLLTESLLLACSGAGAGLLLAPWLYKLLFTFQPGFEIEGSALQGSLDARALGFTALTAVLSGALFGLIPAWQSARADLIPALKDAEAGAAQHKRRRNLHGALVVAQVALAVVVLIGAGLLVRSLLRRFAIDLGFRADNLLIVPLELPRAVYAAANDEAGKRAVDERNNQYFAQVVEKVKALPGVESATTAWITPFSKSIAKTSVVIEGRQPRPGENIVIDYAKVGPGYHK